MNKFLIAAATSNSGKTTFTMGLLRALAQRGLKVQPFKCGPDYIDPMFHRIASGRESVNLDTFMASGDHVKELFRRYGADADVCVVEGVMGLFDGYDKSRGSSAELAQLLDLPVILVVNAQSAAYSVAATIYGFSRFNPNVRIAGVVFNMVASERHYAYLQDACADAGVPCLGYMSRNPELVVPGRHLGLSTAELERAEALVEKAAKEVAPLLLPRGGGLGDSIFLPKENNEIHTVTAPHPRGSWRVAVARDEAFNFTYRANLDTLAQKGTLEFFSPLRDKALPPCDLLYLPGGYPELFASELAANAPMRESIRAFAENGGRIIAECGGFMYLTQAIDGQPMCGVFPMSATMDGARLHLGYRTMRRGDQTLRGHEFHYSSVVEQPLPDAVTVERLQQTAKGMPVGTPLYRYRNVIAGYTHWYWAETGLPFFT